MKITKKAASPSITEWFFHAIVERVVDGDTLDLAILLEPHGTVIINSAAYYDLGFRFYVSAVDAGRMPVFRTRVRLRHVDTPEIRGEERAEGVTAKNAVEEMLPVGGPCLIESYKNATGKYGRWIVNVWPLTTDGVRGPMVNEVLLKRGLAESWP